MKCKLLPLLCLCVAPLAAQTKADHFAVYATYSPTFVDGPTETIANPFSRWFQAPGFGVSIKLGTSDEAVVSLDLRGSIRPDTPGFDTEFVSLKVAAPPVHERFHFYGQLGVGRISVHEVVDVSLVSTRQDLQPVQYSFVPALQLLGGMDYTLSRHVDFRVTEGGIALGLKIGFFDGGGTASGVFPLNTGVVFRF